MRTFDLTPLLRSTVGFDRFDRLFEAVMRQDESALAYPPYNIEKCGEDKYRVTLAVAGFSEDDLEVSVRENTLIVSGKALAEKKDTSYLYHGIARRAFERRFELADHVQVTGASLKDGLLHIDLVREVPEAMKPRRIQIESMGKASKVIDSKAA